MYIYILKQITDILDKDITFTVLQVHNGLAQLNYILYIIHTRQSLSRNPFLIKVQVLCLFPSCLL